MRKISRRSYLNGGNGIVNLASRSARQADDLGTKSLKTWTLEFDLQEVLAVLFDSLIVNNFRLLCARPRMTKGGRIKYRPGGGIMVIVTLLHYIFGRSDHVH